jgi:hypothetical protein
LLDKPFLPPHKSMKGFLETALNVSSMREPLAINVTHFEFVFPSEHTLH